MQRSIQLGKSEFQTSVMEKYISQLSLTDVVEWRKNVLQAYSQLTITFS